MVQLTLVALPLVSVGICFLLVGTYSMKGVVWTKTQKEATFIGANIFYGSPAQIAQKYKLSMYAAPWVGSTIRPVAMLWSIAGMVFVLYRALFGKPLRLSALFFRSWTGAWISTILWVFAFDREIHVLATTINFAIFVCMSLTLQACCKFYSEREQKREAGSQFRLFVLEGLGICTAWSFLAIAMSFAFTLAYKSSLHSEVAVLSGFLTTEECSTIGLIINPLGLVVWWLLDVASWGKLTECIHSIYITFAIVSFSIARNNYNPDAGATMNNMIAFVSGVLSVFAYLTRNKARVLFLGERHLSERSHQD